MNRERSKKKSVVFIVLLLIVAIFGQITVMPLQAAVKKENKKIVVGTNAEYAPFEYRNSDGELTGFDYDLLEAIAAEEDMVLVWRDLPFDSLIGSMEAGDIQIIAAGIGPTEERKQSVDFTDVYYTGSQSIICREDQKISTFADLNQKTVAVLEGSMSDMIASGENCDYGVVENAFVKRFKTASSAIMELKNNAADAVVIDTIMAEIYCKQTDGLKYSEVEGTDEDTVFCVEKGNSQLKELINNGLEKVRENGTYEKLYAAYFTGEDGDGQQILGTSSDKGFFPVLKFIFGNENRWRYYLNGLGITIIVSLLSVFLGIGIGLITAVLRLSADRKGKKTFGSIVTSVYVDIIRGTPSVLQLMIIYFAVFHSRLGYMAAVVSFGINSGAYVSEVIRGGILAVDRGQMEAGRSLGLSYRDTMRFIVMPQAVKNILPAMGNEFIQLIKETSILGYVGIADLTKAASYVSSRTYQMFIPLLAAGIIYYLLVKMLTVILRRFERRLRESD
ncbi:ABC transporter permease subunit [Clostridium sp. Marseille-P2415]|uniref:ABC transporter permease subunit n=1 Tax=Clostridium sp. Marseille-P2415 TaxID=1805471 RepID=UPI0009885C26|nr:ABC transporter permease subunit [Clostridium sp. Marseille-P2415]